MVKETSESFSNSRKTRSVPEKHLEIMLVADHLYLQKFSSDQEATDLLLTLAHMVRDKKSHNLSSLRSWWYCCPREVRFDSETAKISVESSRISFAISRRIPPAACATIVFTRHTKRFRH